MERAIARVEVGGVLQRWGLGKGLQPSRVIYNTLVRGYCKLGVTGQARALELVREMRKVSTWLASLVCAAFTTQNRWSAGGALVIGSVGCA
eukprot:1143209-Pelagomonas_calceolata.AAC.10